MRWFIIILLFSSLLSLAEQSVVTKVAFGSCCKESRPAPIFKTIVDFSPDVWVWMGDNIYGDSADGEILSKKYHIQKQRPLYQALLKESEVIGTWDDHDYGRNDAGKEFSAKKESQAAFLDFIGEAPSSLRRTQEGVYGSHIYGVAGKQVKIILLDTRYHRDKIGSDGYVLGEDQWLWLERQLQHSKAEFHIIVSSIQFLANSHRFEKWQNFPREKQRMLSLLNKEGMPKVFFLSGDRHIAEISVDNTNLNYPLYDITSSSLNSPRKKKNNETNRLRVGENYWRENFGSIVIDWDKIPIEATISIHSLSGEVMRSIKVSQ